MAKKKKESYTKEQAAKEVMCFVMVKLDAIIDRGEQIAEIHANSSDQETLYSREEAERAEKITEAAKAWKRILKEKMEKL